MASGGVAAATVDAGAADDTNAVVVVVRRGTPATRVERSIERIIIMMDVMYRH